MNEQEESAHPRLITERDVVAPARDGTILRADVYRPSTPRRYPVLLTRTPYDKSDPVNLAGQLDVSRAVSRGYVVVVQDVRGRYASGGTFEPFVSEAADGFDAIEWAAQQSWSDGQVGMFGGSYTGYAQWLAATAGPPHLRAIFPLLSTADKRRDHIGVPALCVGGWYDAFLKGTLSNFSGNRQAGGTQSARTGTQYAPGGKRRFMLLMAPSSDRTPTIAKTSDHTPPRASRSRSGVAGYRPRRLAGRVDRGGVAPPGDRAPRDRRRPR